jgi:tetratricopeptide (TPR) repeat protein
MTLSRCCCLAVVGLGLPGVVRAADEKLKEVPPYQRLLRGDDARNAEALQAQVDRYWAAGRFGETLRPAEELVALRQKAQGADHWEAVNARWQAEAVRRVLKQDAATRKEAARLPALTRQAEQEWERGHHGAAQALLDQALAILRKALGEDHPDTAACMNDLATALYGQGRYADAGLLLEEALDIRRKALGRVHPYVALSCNNLAINLNDQGRYAAARPLVEEALAIYRQVLGDNHPDTARAYNNVGYNLNAQGRFADAAPLYEKALAIRRQTLGEEAPDTAQSYNNLALNLQAQGRHADAGPLHEKALDIRRKALSEDHPDTAGSYNNVAYNLNAQRQYADAAPLLRKALAIYRKVLGENHPHVALSYSNLAYNLNAQGQYAEAARMYEKALAIRQKSLGEDHPLTAASYANIASNVRSQGRYADARPLYEKALAVYRKALGEGHSDTASCYNNLASGLHDQGQYAQAEVAWTRAADGFDHARLLLSATGLGRTAATAGRSPLPPLAAVLARNGKAEPAWRRLEESLARGTWDDLSARLRRAPADRDRQTALVQELRRLDQLLESAFTAKETREVKARRDRLLIERRQKADELASLAARLEKQYGPVAGEVYRRAAVQQALSPDAALVGWVDIPGQTRAADPNGEHWAFLLRARGKPACVRLRGSGRQAAWTVGDSRLPAELRRALLDPGGDWRPLGDRLRAQSFLPLAEHLGARDGLPAVRRLIVLPSAALAGVPLEVCATGYTVSYAPSGTMYAYLRQQAPVDGHGLLAVADPVFKADEPMPTAPPPLPAGGVLVRFVPPGSNAARAHLRADDVLLRYADSELKSTADLGRLLQAHTQDNEVRVTVWRAGRRRERTVAGGPLGAAFASKPAPEALAERRQGDQVLAQTRAGAAERWSELPGTRFEAASLAQACKAAGVPFRLLADSDASEQALDRLAASKELAGYRYVHLATHGAMDDRLPLQSAVILSRDRLPDPLKQLEAGQPVYDGRLTAEEVLEKWDLHADLVTLSACETALGKYEGGEGFVGFTQALLLSGARSVCLSLWKVDDTATALLMQRFYANLLGQHKGLAKPRGKAGALAEAKAWLRDLSAEEAATEAAALTHGVARGKGRKQLPLLPAAKAHATGTAAKPYAHPYYWAAFVLVGDGD